MWVCSRDLRRGAGLAPTSQPACAPAEARLETKGRPPGPPGQAGVFRTKVERAGESSRRLLHPVRPETLTESHVTAARRPRLRPHTSSIPPRGARPDRPKTGVQLLVHVSRRCAVHTAKAGGGRVHPCPPVSTRVRPCPSGSVHGRMDRGNVLSVQQDMRASGTHGHMDTGRVTGGVRTSRTGKPTAGAGGGGSERFVVWGLLLG